jgi:hypothetical protein
MSAPGPLHFIFIPGVLLIGYILGYVRGIRSAKEQFERRRKRDRQ